MIPRRTFIKQTGLALAATSLMPNIFFGNTKRQASLGLQLYSLRETIEADVKGTLEKIAAIGYKEVETYGYSPKDQFWGLSVKEFKNIITSNGLNTPSGHYGLDDYLKEGGGKSDFAYAVEVARDLDQKYITVPYISEPLRTSLDDYKLIAEKLNKAGEVCKEAGLKLAYHNHAFEFEEYEAQNGYEIFLNNTEKDLVAFEMDIYWVVRSGKDPLELFEKYPGRFPLWHVKDMSKLNHELNTEIGNGTINFKKIFNKVEQAGGKHFIVEQENFEMEPYKSLSQSYQFIKKDLLHG